MTYIRKHTKDNLKNKAQFIDFIANGRFAITKITSAKEVCDYLIKSGRIEFTDISREDMDANGVVAEGNSRMQFWETHITEQYLSLLDFADIRAKSHAGVSKNKLNLYSIIEFELGSAYTLSLMYEKLCLIQRFDVVEECFEFTLPLYKYHSFTDLFGGRGTWLRIIKKMFNECDRYKLTFVYNELDNNKYEAVQRKFDFSFNEPAEDLLDGFPKRTIDTMIFNPPYGSTNGQRNVNRFLQLIVESEVLKPEESNLVFLLNKHDLMDSMDFICSNFSVNFKTLKRLSNKLEFDSLGQYYFIGTAKGQDFKRESSEVFAKEAFKNFFENENEDSSSKEELISSKKLTFLTTAVIIDTKLTDFKITRDLDSYSAPIASKGLSKTLSELTFKVNEEKILVPKPLTASELSFFVATGKLNGDMSIEVAPGVKETITIASGIERIVETEFDADTDKEYETIKNVPFLSLYRNGSLKTIQYN